MYKVRFQSGLETEVESCKLKVVRDEDIPPTLRITNTAQDESGDDDTIASRPDSINHDASVTNDVPMEDEEEEPESQDTHDTMLTIDSGSNDNESDEDVPLSYTDKLIAARDKLRNLTGDTVEKRKNNDSIIWTVVEEHVCDSPDRSDTLVGLKPDVLAEVMEDNTMIASEIFLRLMFGGNMVEAVTKANIAIRDFNEKNGRAKPISFFSHSEFLRGIAVLIGAVCFSSSGNQLWKKTSEEDPSNDFVSIEPSAQFYKWMSKFRFKEFRQFLPSIYEDRTKMNTDPWWKFIGGVEQFNLNRLKYVVSSNHLALDELMMAWRPRKTKTGGLPNITHIPRKPEPLGTEFKCSTCSTCKVMLNMELQRGKEEMKKQTYNRELGPTAGCTLRLSEAW